VIVEGHWTLVRDATGRPRSILALDSDISEKKALEAQVLRAQRLESIGTLAGGIAHDLNNVLSPILMATEVLARNTSDEGSHRMLQAIRTSALRGGEMVSHILAFARGVDGERAPLEPAGVLRDVEKIIRDTFPKNVEVRFEIPHDSWPVIGDATQLHQVLLNLCVNARDAMRYGGTLRLSVEHCILDESYARMHLEARVGRYVVLTVADTGMGMPPEILDKIFDPFFTTKDAGKGTGLGLSTSNAIVRSHGGFINVYSEPGRGSVFRVYLPAALEPVVRQEGAMPVRAMAGYGERILVVDDEPSVREVTQAVVEAHGYRAVVANDGAEAVALYALDPKSIDAVVTDVRMPLMDGVATVRALRRINPAVKVILTSGFSEPSSDGVLREQPPIFLKKPYAAEQLLTALRRLLEPAASQAQV
jgi:nitrogen-specific signal transduction histidine kinase/ActR/RegA family two-component response regulator